MRAAFTRLMLAMRALVSMLELRDVFFVAGFALIFAGGARLSLPWTMVGAGVALVVLSLPWRSR